MSFPFVSGKFILQIGNTNMVKLRSTKRPQFAIKEYHTIKLNAVGWSSWGNTPFDHPNVHRIVHDLNILNKLFWDLFPNFHKIFHKNNPWLRNAQLWHLRLEEVRALRLLLFAKWLGGFLNKLGVKLPYEMTETRANQHPHRPATVDGCEILHHQKDSWTPTNTGIN